MIGKVQDIVSAAVVVGAVDATRSVANDSNSQSASAQSAKHDTATQSALAPSKVQGTNESNASENNVNQKKEESQEKEPMSESSVDMMTQELNELMDKINCDLQFSYNKDVDMMSVKMVDKKTEEVIKEFPPEEMLENMAKAKEWIGAFIDKNA